MKCCQTVGKTFHLWYHNVEKANVIGATFLVVMHSGKFALAPAGWQCNMLEVLEERMGSS